MAHLIITNGESAAARMREAGLTHDILCWRDILHEGPVPETSGLAALSVMRAQFLAGRGWSGESELTAAFSARDASVGNHASYESVVIWLEHDLYDQLQLLQILDFFAGEPGRAGLYMIQAGRHLGQESPAALRRHLRLVEPVTPRHFSLARMAWKAFRADTPEAWSALLHFDTSPLPFLRMAVLRQLEEFPSPRTGLTRTEFEILRLIREGRVIPKQIYADFSEEEAAMFMGDWSFWHILDQLGAGYAPLVVGFNGYAFSPQMSEIELEPYLNCPLRVTNLALNALAGRTDAAMHRRIDRWIGGVHLTNANLWRWDAENRRLAAP